MTSTTTQQPYRILNDDFGTEGTLPGHPSTFPLFSRLPAEVRTQIWNEAIPTHRFIRVLLDNDFTEQFPELYTAKNALRNTISGCPYQMKAAKSGEWSPDILLKVNREANSVFRSHYRLRLPLPVKGGDGSVKSLYIHPETDIVWLATQQNTRTDPLLISFLHDLVAYDPNGVGIRHLALGGTHPNDISTLANLEPSRLPLPARHSLKKLVSSSLQSFYAVVDATEGRTTIGVMSSPQADFHHNRSIPVVPRTTCYTRLERDPRAIEADLTHVSAGLDPRRTMYLWNRFKANFGAAERHIDTRYLLSLVLKSPMAGREDFVQYMQREDDTWAEWTARLSQPIWGERMTKEEYEAQRTTLPQAAGFWSFPEEAFGDFPNVSSQEFADDGTNWQIKMIKDLSEHHPEVWVFNLP